MADKIDILMSDGYYSPSTVLWLLAEDLTVRQAALLMLNEDPEHFPHAEYPNQDRHAPIGYQAARQVIASALLAHKVDGSTVWKTTTVYEEGGFGSHEEDVVGDVCADKSTINMDSLRAWLATKNVTVEQFAGLSGTSDDFLDRENPTYSAKLAATIAAWRYVKQNPIGGMSIKQQLTNWLKDNSARYWPDGTEPKVTDTFVNEAARIANWDADGGRPVTSDNKMKKNVTITSPKLRSNFKTDIPTNGIDYSDDLDDEIPF